MINSEDQKPSVPTISTTANAVRTAPPHPLDAEWHMLADGQVYGPFKGHKMKEFVADGRLTTDHEVCRYGTENWVRAADDPALGRIFATAHSNVPAISTQTGGGSVLVPDGAVHAARGAQVVQVHNHIVTPQPQPFMDLGVAANKSPALALILSILIVGLGQIYNGEWGKGIGMFVVCIVLWFVFLGWIINIWSWIDAYTTARDMRDRYQRRLASGAMI